MRNITIKLLLGFVLVSYQSRSQVVVDAMNLFAAKNNVLRGQAIDAEGNVCFYGTVNGPLKINGTTQWPNYEHDENYSIVIKLDSNSNVLWYRRFDYQFFDWLSRADIVCDDEGNIYISDEYSSRGCRLDEQFFEWAGEDKSRVTYKLDKNGSLVWAKNFGGYNYFYDDDHLSFTGFYSPDGYLDGQEITKPEGSTLVVKVDKNGTYVNHFTFDFGPRADTRIYGINKDHEYFGYYANTVNTPGEDPLMIFKFDSSGEFLMKKRLGYISEFAPHRDFSFILDTTSGNYYFAGNLYHTENVGDHTPSDGKIWKIYRLDEEFNTLTTLVLKKPRTDGNLKVRLKLSGGHLFVTETASTGSSTRPIPCFFGQSNYFEAFDNQKIIAKLSMNLGVKWFRALPTSLSRSDLFNPNVGGDKIHYPIHHDSLIVDSVNIGSEAIFIMSILDQDSLSILDEFQGSLFYDVDMDGQYSNEDLPISHSPIINSELPGYQFYTNSEGMYTANVVSGKQTISSIRLPRYWMYSTPESFELDVDSRNVQVVSTDIGMHPIPGVTDLSVNVLPLTAARPGFDVVYQIKVCNVGTDTVASELRIIQNEELHYLGSTIEVDYMNDDYLSFDLPPIAAQDCFRFKLTDSLSAKVELLDSGVEVFAEVIPVEQDTVLENNEHLATIIVTGSYDPNDISVFPSCGITESFVQREEFLEYLVRFQNTGTDTAFTVVIVDSLSPYMNLTSLELMSSSHDVELNIHNRVLTATFDQILLPDYNIDYDGSNGFIKYRVKLDSNFTLGQTVDNKAEIYFDYNPPIITNTVSTQLVDLSEMIRLIVTPVSCEENSDGAIGIDLSCLTTYPDVSFDGADFTQLRKSNIGGLSIGEYDVVFAVQEDTLSFSAVEVTAAELDQEYKQFFACQGDSVNFNGRQIVKTGTYVDTLSNQYGCDSVVTADIEFYRLPMVELSDPEEDTMCLYSDFKLLPEGTPEDGEYSGTGVVDDYFNPSICGVGSQAIYYTVVDENNCSNTDSVEVFIDPCTSIFSESVNEIQIHPNPTCGLVYINGEIPSNVVFMLYDISGRYLQNLELIDGRIDLSNMRKGMYILQVLHGEKQNRFKVLKQ